MTKPYSLDRAKRVAENNFPHAYGSVRRFYQKVLLHRMLRQFAGREGPVVQAGPFRGLRYLPELIRRENLDKYAIFPKVLGSYEEELSDTLLRAIVKGYDRVINIGCADGYYAVGFARGQHGIRVHAFDIDSEAREICRLMAQLNGVMEQVIVGGECTITELAALAGKGALVICDCEGCELDLIRPDVAPGLLQSDLIVELHDCVEPTISRTILDRFARTHDVLVLTGRDRDPLVYDSLARFGPYKCRLAVSEWRWATPLWGVMTSRP